VIAQRFALDYPQLTKGLVIVGSAASLKDNPGMPEFYDQVKALADPMDKTFMDEFQKSTLAKPIDPTWYNVLVAEGMKVPVRVFKEALLGLMKADYTLEINNIKSPVLILWGAKDSFITEENQAQLVKQIRHSEFIIYEETGHALHWEEPNRFVNDLVGFVTKSTVKK
jgi:non-heme chloroperoxidase